MRINYYNFNDFKINKLTDNWFLIKNNQLGDYLFNVDSVEVAKIPKNITSDQITKTITNRVVTPQKTYGPENFFNSGKVPRLMLFPTASCNLNCIYCHCDSNCKDSHMSDSILVESLSKYLEFVKRNANVTNGIEITFMGGGEPFVKFDSIKEVVSLLKEKEIKVKYSIVTNGTLGSDDDWLWLQKENFSITISADGPPEIQNYQRPFNTQRGTSEVLEKRLIFLSNRKIKVNIRTTVINSEEENIDKICNYFKVFKCVQTHHLEPVSFAGRGIMLTDDNISDFYKNFFSYYSKYLYTNPERFKSAWFKPFQKSDGFCGAVYHNAIVTHDGYVTLCTEVDSKSLNNPIGSEFIVSMVTDTNPFESSKAINFSNNNSVKKLPYCKDCIIRYKCGGGCYVKRSRDFSNDPSLYYNAYCENVIALHLSYLLQLYGKRLKNQHKII